MQPNNLLPSVALYARVSSDEQREGHTIDSQIAELDRFAKQNAWLIAGTYKDEGWSGAMLARPALDKLRDDASKHRFQSVLVNDVDRLARDVAHLGIIKRDLERQGVQVIFRKLPTEKSPTHDLMVNILGSFAEFERELIADRVRRGKRHKVETKKQYMGTIAPYGLRYLPKRRTATNEGLLEINSEEAAIVRLIYSLVDSEKLSAGGVTNRLNQEGVRPRKGEHWARSSVLHILRSEVYAGIWHYYKYEPCEPIRKLGKNKYRRSLKTSNRLRTRSEWVGIELASALRIIERSQWERVQRQLDRNRTFSPRNSRHAYLLAGLVRCAACGATYVGDPSHGSFYYRCNRRCKDARTTREELLNDSIWSAVTAAILNPQLIVENVIKVNDAARTQVARNGADLADADKLIHQIESEETRLLEAYRLSVISAAQLGSELEKLTAKRSWLDAKRAKLQEQIPKLSVPLVSRSVEDYCARVEERLATISPEEKRQLLRLLVNEIIFDGATAKIKGIIPVVEARSSEHETDNVRPALPAGRTATTDTLSHGHNPAREFEIATTDALSHGHNPVLEFEITTALIRTRASRRRRELSVK